MQLILLALLIIFAFTYLIIWLRNKSRPFKKDGTPRDTFMEAISASFKFLLLAIVCGIVYLGYDWYDGSQSTKINTQNLTGKWRSDDAILVLNENGTFEFNRYATDNKRYSGNWKLEAGVLFLEGDELVDNLTIESVGKKGLNLKHKVEHETFGSGYTIDETEHYSRVE